MQEMYKYDNQVKNSLTKVVVDNVLLESNLQKLMKKPADTELLTNSKYLINGLLLKFDKERKISVNFELKLPQLMDCLSMQANFVDYQSPFTDYHYTKSFVLFNQFQYDLITNSKDNIENNLKNLYESVDKINSEKLFTEDKFLVFRRYSNPLAANFDNSMEDKNRLNGQTALAIKQDKTQLLKQMINMMTLSTQILQNCMVQDYLQLAENSCNFFFAYKKNRPRLQLVTIKL